MPLLELQLRPTLHRTLTAMYESRRGDTRTLQEFLLQIIEVSAAEYRASKIPALQFETIQPGEPDPIPAAARCFPHRRTFGAMSQRILFLHISMNLSVREIAMRVGCSPTTVRRILGNFARTEHVDVPTARTVIADHGHTKSVWFNSIRPRKGSEHAPNEI